MQDDELCIGDIYRICNIEGDHDIAGHKPTNLNGLLVKLLRKVTTAGTPSQPIYYQVELVAEHKYLWSTREFALEASHMEDATPPTPEEIEAAKRRTTELLGELEVL